MLSCESDRAPWSPPEKVARLLLERPKAPHRAPTLAQAWVAVDMSEHPHVCVCTEIETGRNPLLRQAAA